MNKIIYILLFFTLTISLSAQTKTKDVLLFEIESFFNPGNANGQRRSSTSTYFIYQSGRIACKSLLYAYGKEFRRNKSKCLKASQTKINELTELAERTDFQTDSYQYFSRGVFQEKSFTITYFKKDGNKEIRLTTPRRVHYETRITLSLEKFLTKLGEIDEGLKVEYELGKK